MPAPFGTLDDPNSSLISALDVDLEPGNGGIDLTGDNHDLAFIFQFYDQDGVFSFTENYDDRVKIVATPISGSTNLTPAQIQSTKIDRETKVPHYLKIHWISENDFRCEEKVGASSNSL